MALNKVNLAIQSILSAANGVLANVTINETLVKALTSQQKWIGLTGQELSNAIHMNASLCLFMAEKSETHDAHALNGLVKQLAGSIRVKGLIGWIQMFSPIRFNGDGKIGVLKADDKGYTPWQTQKAYETPFWEIKELDEKVPTELSVEALKAIITKFAQQVADANDKGEVVSKTGKVTKMLKGDKTVIQDYTNRLLGISPRPQQVVHPAAEQPTMQPVEAKVG